MTLQVRRALNGRRANLPFGWAAAAAAVGGIASSVIGGGAAKSAANTQAQAQQQATAAQLQMFNTLQDENAPFRQGGYNALADIQTGQGAPVNSAGTASGTIAPGYFNQTFNNTDLNSQLAPNYAFMLGQGLGTQANLSNLNSGVFSGNAAQGLTSYAENYAGNAYQNAYNNFTNNQNNIFNRLSTVAGLGQVSSGNPQTGASSFSTGAASTIAGAGASQAAGTIGAANALTGGINNASGALGWYGLSQQPSVQQSANQTAAVNQLWDM